jgi:hypothetical protein
MNATFLEKSSFQDEFRQFFKSRNIGRLRTLTLQKLSDRCILRTVIDSTSDEGLI